MAEDLLHKRQFPPYTPKKGEEYMSAKQLAHFHAILTSLKDELSEDIERTVHTMQDEATVFRGPE
jgi:DnaK suppressor protein